MDDHYTPSWAAEVIASLPRTRKVSVVADVAAGRGDLLLAAHARWPKARLLAVELRKNTANDLRSLLPSSSRTIRMDALSKSGRAVNEVIGDGRWRPDVVLLNPPFSTRGNERRAIFLRDGTCVRGSVAATFFALACDLVRNGGTVVAILPRSFGRSEKDSAIRRHLSSCGALRVVEDLPDHLFHDVVAATSVVVFIKRKVRIGVTLAVEQPLKSSRSVVITRGNVPLHTLSSRGLRRRWVHTTHLRDGQLLPAIAVVKESARLVTAPVVLVPRVGRRFHRKIVVYSSSQPLALSDCVFGIETDTQDDAELVASALMRRFKSSEELQFAATGAPYMTLRDLTAELASCGFIAQQANRDEDTMACLRVGDRK